MEKIDAGAFGDSNEAKVKTISYNGVDVQVKQRLTYSEMHAFVNVVANGCFDDDGNYIPEVKDYIIRCVILRMYTNIDIPEDDYSCYEFVYENEDLILAITSSFDNMQFNIIEEAIDNKIAYMIKTQADKINKRFDEITKQLDELTGAFSALFDGIDADEIEKLVTALSESGFDEDKFIETYVKQSYETE